MSKSTRTSKTKPSLKVKDLKPKKNPKGGGADSIWIDLGYPRRIAEIKPKT